jgi:hypothetical protein
MPKANSNPIKRPVGRPRRGISKTSLYHSKLVFSEVKECDLEEELSEIERMDLTELENIGDIAGKYRFIKFKYRGRIADEFRMRVVNSLALRKTPSTVIAMALNVSPSTVCILRKKLKTHICKQISRVSLNEYLGESLIAYEWKVYQNGKRQSSEAT